MGNRYIILSVLFLILPFSLVRAEISLKEKLAEAEPGSFIVTEQNKIFTFVHVNEKQGSNLILEEVVIPASKFARCRLPWRYWFEQGAPGHTAWTLTQINVETGALEEIFSFTHQGWIDTSQTDSFMSTLLNLCFKEIPENQRRRIGIPPAYGKADRRPLWNPRLVVDGNVIPDASFTVWKARWPSDGSEMSHKIMEIYTPDLSQSSQLPKFPTYFPFWIEVEGKIGHAKIRVIDSGTGVQSPMPRLPRRPLQLIGNGLMEGKGLTIRIKSPSYFHDFIVIAEEAESSFGKTFVLPCQTEAEGDLLKLFVAKSELEKLMTTGEQYRFSISPKDDPSVCIETQNPLTYR